MKTPGWTRFSLLALLAAALAGCESNPQSSYFVPTAQTSQSASQPSSEKRIAVTYNFALNVPARDVEAAQQSHLAACRRLGCEVLSTQLDRTGPLGVSGRISVRITPEAFPEFERAISAPPAEVARRAESTEDKTLPLLDAEKRLEVKSALRERFIALLRDPSPKSAADIAGIEGQISEVQAEIESATAQRDYLRTITQTVRVDLIYSSASARSGGIDISPISNAASRAADTLTHSIATLITFIIALVPWLAIGVPIFVLARRLLRLLRRKR